MNEILISISPKQAENILNGKQTVIVRKTTPKEVPFKGYIYCTYGTLLYSNYPNGNSSREIKLGSYKVSGENHIGHQMNGKVVAEFVCNKVEHFVVGSLRCDDIEKKACLSYKEMINYFYKSGELDGKTIKYGYAIHISDLVIYDKPKELSEFGVFCGDYAKCENITCYKDNCRQGFIPLTRPPQSWQYVVKL